MNSKKQHHKLRKQVRYINRSVKRDTVYQGRFYIQEFGYAVKDGIAYMAYIFIDKQTGKEDIPYGHWFNCFEGWKLWGEFNEFVCEAIGNEKKQETKEVLFVQN